MPLDTISTNEIFTGFANQSATSKFERPFDLIKLAEFIKSTRASEKAELPWIKCARFGDVASDRGCLRHDANVLAITGVEGDYDGGEMTIKEATARIREAGVEALLYTTPGSTPQAPRWRVIAPLGYERTGDEATLRKLRSLFLARLNGVLGGVLAPESFVLSQAYYCGGIEGGPEIEVEHIEAALMVDERPDLDACAIGRPVTSPRAAAAGVDLDLRPAIARATEYLKHAAPAVEGNGGNNTTYRLAADLFDLGVSLDTALELAESWNERCDPPWSPEELATVFGNAWRYHQNPPGCDAVASVADSFAAYVPPQSQTSETAIEGAAEAAGERNGSAASYDSRDGIGHSAAPAAIDGHKIRRLTSAARWIERDIPEQDCMLGSWLTTTSRTMIYAETGIGKTHFALTLAAHVAAGQDFLHWTVGAPRKVLYIDGEMPEGLAQERLIDATRRLGFVPEGLLYLNRDDFPEMEPLNTPDGRDFIESVVVAHDGVHLIVFDNIQSLLNGNLRETDSWAAILPWVRDLSRQKIGQIWVHHTGRDGEHAYGDSSREWGLDTVLRLDPVEDDPADICFDLHWQKTRMRKPSTRGDYVKHRIKLEGDHWVGAAVHREPSSLARDIHAALALSKVFDASYGWGHAQLADAMWGEMSTQLSPGPEQHAWQTERGRAVERLRDFARKPATRGDATKLGDTVAEKVGSAKMVWKWFLAGQPVASDAG